MIKWRDRALGISPDPLTPEQEADLVAYTKYHKDFLKKIERKARRRLRRLRAYFITPAP
jgi:hypothetical protein